MSAGIASFEINGRRHVVICKLPVQPVADRGRNSRLNPTAPPSQIRTCRINAYGSYLG